ncbi:hypothetical protein V6N11_034242 [Hibiscus sabdariffa]|uniref:Uncharacterized protein n=1 Tax=Hibiscus sabdariffa TaxID=183260 RepID=A0ABR1ZGT2_9ROSI
MASYDNVLRVLNYESVSNKFCTKRVPCEFSAEDRVYDCSVNRSNYTPKAILIYFCLESDMVTVEVQGVAGSREVTCPSDARSCSIVVVDEARIQRSQAFKNQWSRFDLNGDVA